MPVCSYSPVNELLEEREGGEREGGGRENRGRERERQRERWEREMEKGRGKERDREGEREREREGKKAVSIIAPQSVRFMERSSYSGMTQQYLNGFEQIN